jgi:hypothetical protein
LIYGGDDMGALATAAQSAWAWLTSGTATAKLAGTALAGAAGATAASAMTPKPEIPEIKVAPTVTPTAANDITTAKQEERRKQKLKQGLAATMKTGGMGLTSRANINKPVLGTTNTGKKTLLGQ